MTEVKIGDDLTFTQKDGCVINIFVREEYIFVKAERPGTCLVVDEVNSFCITARAVDSKLHAKLEQS
jgi:hypothetical protein